MVVGDVFVVVVVFIIVHIVVFVADVIILEV